MAAPLLFGLGRLASMLPRFGGVADDAAMAAARIARIQSPSAARVVPDVARVAPDFLTNAAGATTAARGGASLGTTLPALYTAPAAGAGAAGAGAASAASAAAPAAAAARAGSGYFGMPTFTEALRGAGSGAGSVAKGAVGLAKGAGAVLNKAFVPIALGGATYNVARAVQDPDSVTGRAFDKIGVDWARDADAPLAVRGARAAVNSVDAAGSLLKTMGLGAVGMYGDRSTVVSPEEALAIAAKRPLPVDKALSAQIQPMRVAPAQRQAGGRAAPAPERNPLAGLTNREVMELMGKLVPGEQGRRSARDLSGDRYMMYHDQKLRASITAAKGDKKKIADAWAEHNKNIAALALAPAAGMLMGGN